MRRFGEVAQIIHHMGPRRASITRGVHGEGVVTRLGQIGHPAITLDRHIEGHLGRRARAVNKQDHLALEIGTAQRRSRQSTFTHVDTCHLTLH